MRFFDRKREIDKLKDIEQLSNEVAQFTVLSGRRRIGKTSLVREAYKETELVYFFVARKAESDLCETFMDSISTALNIPVVGRVTRFADVFKYIMQLAKTRHITLMIDEFQEFFKINSSIYSEMQDIWDENKKEAKINLIVCGSVNSLINKIFRDKKEPLYGRQTNLMRLRAFTPSVLKEIMKEYHPEYTAEDLLALYLITGGVAKYVELLVDRRCLTLDKILSYIFERDSYFLDEGKNMLIEEFGKEYGTYFSILSQIASGHNTRSEIEDFLGMELGGYIKKLTDDYELISKQQPLFEQSANKNVRYSLSDHFLRFWFRFIYKYSYILEAGGHERLRTIVERDYTSYSGKVLEAWFRDCLVESGQYTRIGYWHDRKGENEIDIVAADDIDKRVEFYEVKRQEKSIDLSILRAKADAFSQNTNQYKKYRVEYKGLSMEEM